MLDRPMAARTAADPNASTLERALSIVTEVKAGEGLTALLLTVNVFLLLTAYYVIKPVREGLILAMEHGAEKKSYVSAAIAVTLLFAVPAYGKVKDRVAKHKLVVGVTLFFASHLLVFWVLSHTALRKELGLVFFTWVGVFNMMVVAQFWSFANDLYTQEQGKRLFAIVGIGASLGSAVGAYITKFLKGTIGLGVFELLLVAAGFLATSAFLSQAVHAREKRLAERDDEHAEERAAEKAKKEKEAEKAEANPQGGFTLVARNRYLLLLAAFSLVFTIVDTNGEYILSNLAGDRAREAAALQQIPPDQIDKFSEGFIAAFYGSFYLWVNVIGLTIQTFLVSRIVKLGGLKLAFFIYPAIALGSSINNVVTPGLLGVDRLTAFRPTKTAENAVDYSLNNTVRNMLWLPTTTEMKYKAKQAVDTFFVRMGDVASAGLVFVFGARLAWPVERFSMINIVLVALWILIAIGIVRQNARLSAEKEKREGREEDARSSSSKTETSPA
jgi:ATP:ADP antiporter, AAA family